MKTARIQKYHNYIVIEDFLILYNYSNVMQLPKIDQVSVSTTSKNSIADKKGLVNAFAACFLLTGQKGIFTRARKSIAGFKLRKGSNIGCMVTIRRKQMYYLLDKVVTFILPRLYNSSRRITNISFGEKEKQLSPNRKDVAKKRCQPYTLGVYNSLFWPEAESLLELFQEINGFNITVALSKSNIKNVVKTVTNSKDSQKEEMLELLSPQKKIVDGFIPKSGSEQRSFLFLNKEQLEKGKLWQIYSKYYFDKKPLSFYALQKKGEYLVHRNQREIQHIFFSAFQHSRL